MDHSARKRDIGGCVIALIFILVGGVAWWSTYSMVDMDSYIFPRAVILVMVVCSALYVLNTVMARATVVVAATGNESHSRRILIVLVMLGGALLMPYIGFVLSGLLTFAAITGAAMYDKWSKANVIGFSSVGLGVVVGFYVLFTQLLYVPLPSGTIWE